MAPVSSSPQQHVLTHDTPVGYYEALRWYLLGSFYFAYTLYLFVCDNLGDIVCMGYLFGALNATIASKLSMGPDLQMREIFLSTPRMILWSLSNLLLFNIHNQRHPSAMLEDHQNKPWRPLPAGRVSPQMTNRLMFIMYPVVLLISYHWGGMVPCLLEAFSCLWYNEWGGASDPFLKNLLNGVGLACFFAGPLEVVAGRCIFTGGGKAAIWLGILSACITTTVHTQDFRDVKGDLATGRRTVPLVIGDVPARILVAVGVVTGTGVVCWFWDATWLQISLPAVIGGTVPAGIAEKLFGTTLRSSSSGDWPLGPGGQALWHWSSPQQHQRQPAVGGGTSGLVVATRLSEYSKHNVLVIEAGADHTADPRVQIPALFDTLKDSDLDWKFKSEPQPALGGRTINLNQGKALGGSSAINAFVFVPPTKHLIDSWKELGNEGWDWDSLQPFFSKAFTSPPRVDASSSTSLGVDRPATSNQAATGPVQTSFSGNLTDLVRESWIDAFGAEHRLMPGDPFVNPTVGAFSCISSIHPERKERSYSASAYYMPVRDRENLHILTEAEVMRIVFDNTKAGLPAHALGVEYKHQGTTSIAFAKKEVILAAGAFQSPKILELSGVGDAKLLNQLGIEVVVDLPAVGENLQDHAVASICFETTDDVDTLDALVRQEPEAVAQAMQDYGTSRTGPMSTWELRRMHTYRWIHPRGVRP
ncbi:hypothetical protein EKO27_g11662 [Xylaria grammica]|uniref:Glucose-methanol-choline oxidoreductase N-terminal domain-containing protein n=1 Tax=Xylaria grammica TaxID=363999 RepID=A0A439CMR5_9PEZI|nr:hypothetical protein EKO27_g11662 [Xylaria grammica]